MSNNSKILYLGMFLVLSFCTFAKYDPNTFDPDNAAHWYRKAFALYEEPNGIDLGEFVYGEMELTPKIEKFLEKQQPVIELIKKASQLEHCDWEIEPLLHDISPHLDVAENAKNISYFLLANIRYCETKNQKRKIFDDFKLSLQLAYNIDSNVLIRHLTSLALRTMTYDAIHEYLNRHLDCKINFLYNIENLIKKEYQLYKFSYIDTRNHGVKLAIKHLTDYKKHIYSDKWWTEEWGIPVEKLSEDFYRRNLDFHKNYMHTIQNFLELPYPEATKKIDLFNQTFFESIRNYFSEHKEAIDKRINNLDGLMLADIELEHIEKCDFLYTIISASHLTTTFSIETKTLTKLNALKVGTKLLIEHRETKEIPETLPLNSPIDLFSNKPFLIVKTEDGFKLKCQGKDLTNDEINEYEFKLPKD